MNITIISKTIEHSSIHYQLLHKEDLHQRLDKDFKLIKRIVVSHYKTAYSHKLKNESNDIKIETDTQFDKGFMSGYIIYNASNSKWANTTLTFTYTSYKIFSPYYHLKQIKLEIAPKQIIPILCYGLLNDKQQFKYNHHIQWNKKTN